MRPLIAALSLTAFVAVCSDSRAASAAEAPAPAKQDDLAWLAGDWCGADDNQVIEESWFTPQAHEAIGMSRTTQGGRMISFEFMRIQEVEGVISYVAQPGGDAPTSFKRSDGGDGWIRFENKEHDYPQRIEYRKAGDGLHAEIGGPGAGDKEEVISYDYRRCRK